MRHEDVGRRRQSAPGSPGGLRSNALWGGKREKLPMLLAVLLVLAALIGAGQVGHAEAAKSTAYVPESLLSAATSNPNAVFDVIVQGRGRSTRDVANDVGNARNDAPGRGFGVRRRFASIAGTSAQLTGRQILRLADRRGILSITPDAKTAAEAYSNSQAWPAAAGANNWSTPPAGTTYPAIAIVDSGVQSRSEFGSRLLAQVNFVSTGTNSSGDGRGHGTMVASIAANGGSSYTGAEPRANLVALDVLDDNGNGRVSDVIAACDWILAHKDEYNIRVANLSLNAGGSAFYADPLDHAVESLWLNGVVVVVASGNYGTSDGPTGVVYSPANDPFVITVGASGTNSTVTTADDYAAPWSAWGYTNEGFLKPEIAAPGRWMRGLVPYSASL